jgi:NRPS condensation-like uncharacterized protein
MNRTTKWFKIDNAGKLFPIITGKLRASYFRLSIVLKETIDPVVLQRAAEKTLFRFPNFNTRLRKGLFWYYLENQSKLFKVQPDPNMFGTNPRPNDRFKHLIEIYYHRQRISIEVFHSITDGRGGMEFLKTLTLAYLREKGYAVDAEGIIFDANDQVTNAELEDSFATKVTKGNGIFLPTENAFHLKGTYFEHTGHYLTHLHLSTKELIAVAKAKQTTITGLFATMLILILIQKQEALHPKKRKKIILSIPVDMRKYIPSKTMKNFVMTINIGSIFKPNATFQEVLDVVNQQLKKGQQLEILAPQIRANLKVEQMLLLRFIPLFIKRWVIKFVFNRVGENALSIVMSNLGKIEMPQSTQSFIDHFDFTLCATPILPINVAMATFLDQLVITFSRIIDDRSFIQAFVNMLVKDLNVNVKASGNRWEEGE